MWIFLYFSPSPKWTLKLGISYAGVFYEYGFSLIFVTGESRAIADKNIWTGSFLWLTWFQKVDALSAKHSSYNVNFPTGNQISTEDSPDSQSCMAFRNILQRRSSLCLFPWLGFSSISSSPAASLSPATLHHSPRQWRLYGCKFLCLCRDWFLHLEVPSPHLYMLNSVPSSRSCLITVFS